MIRRLPRWAAWFCLALWAALSIVAQSTLMVSHWYTLPSPNRADPALEEALAALVPEAEQGSWTAVHVLYSACRCSQRVFEHLFESSRPEGLYEVVLLVGGEASLEARAAAAGFDVVTLSPRDLEARFGIVSAPLLLVSSPGGELRYAGGYTERKQGYAVEDLEVIGALQAGVEPSELPLYGCGVSKELQQILDPMGLKYD